MKNFPSVSALPLSLLLLTGFVLTACSDGDSGGNASESGHVRYINVDYSQATSQINRGADLSNPEEEIKLNYGESTNYNSMVEGVFSFIAFEQNSPVLRAPDSTSIRNGDFVSVVVTRTNSQDDIIFLDDANIEAAEGTFNFRLANFYNNERSLDFYFIELGASIEELEPTQNGIRFQGDSGYFPAISLNNGQKVIVTPAGSKTVIFDSGPLSFENKKSYTMFLIPRLGGNGPPEGFLLVDGE